MVTERLGTVIDGIAGALVDAVQNYVDFAKLHTDFASMGPLIERIWNKDFGGFFSLRSSLPRVGGF